MADNNEFIKSQKGSKKAVFGCFLIIVKKKTQILRSRNYTINKWVVKM